MGIHFLGLLAGAAVVPEDGGTDDVVVLIQSHQTVHLAAGGQALDLGGVDALQQLGNQGADSVPPVLGVLLGPAGLGELQRIGLGNGLADGAGFIHQKNLHGGCAEIDADVIHRVTS